MYLSVLKIVLREKKHQSIVSDWLDVYKVCNAFQLRAILKIAHELHWIRLLRLILNHESCLFFCVFRIPSTVQHKRTKRVITQSPSCQSLSISNEQIKSQKVFSIFNMYSTVSKTSSRVALRQAPVPPTCSLCRLPLFQCSCSHPFPSFSPFFLLLNVFVQM